MHPYTHIVLAIRSSCTPGAPPNFMINGSNQNNGSPILFKMVPGPKVMASKVGYFLYSPRTEPGWGKCPLKDTFVPNCLRALNSAILFLIFFMFFNLILVLEPRVEIAET